MATEMGDDERGRSGRRRTFSVTGRHEGLPEPHVTIRPEEHPAVNAEAPLIVVTQAFGPTGASLIENAVTFDGWPAVAVGVRAAGQEGVVYLSPIHGDARKVGMDELPLGVRCELYCPHTGAPLKAVGPVEDGSGAYYFAIYLTPKLSAGESVQISDIWGHYHSRIIDDMELISYWADSHDGDDA